MEDEILAMWHLVEVVDAVGGEQQLVGRVGDGGAVVRGEEEPADGQRVEALQDLKTTRGEKWNLQPEL